MRAHHASRFDSRDSKRIRSHHAFLNQGENDFIFFIFDFAVFLWEDDFMIFVTKLTDTKNIVFQSFNISNSSESGY